RAPAAPFSRRPFQVDGPRAPRARAKDARPAGPGSERGGPGVRLQAPAALALHMVRLRVPPRVLLEGGLRGIAAEEEDRVAVLDLRRLRRHLERLAADRILHLGGQVLRGIRLELRGTV